MIDACRAVPDESVPADLLIDEPIITSSLELVMQSVTNLLAEAIEKLKSADQAAQEFAARELASEAAHPSALASASTAAVLEMSHAVEDSRSKVTKLWGADQLSHKEKGKELEDRLK